MSNRIEQLKQIIALEEEIGAKKKQLASLRMQVDPLPFEDLTLQGLAGPMKISQLFGQHSELLLISNMGENCAYCTLWADGFNGFYQHITTKAAFVLTSPDTPEQQQKFAASRNWQYPMYSNKGTMLLEMLDFVNEKGWIYPAVASFTKNADGSILLNNKAVFGPGDNYCSAYDLMDLLPSGLQNFQPKVVY